jgi:4-amino-4-deoxy-L-arabinose transferase-like glycosyltransferase
MEEEGNKQTNKLFIILLALIIVFHVVNNISYLSLDTRPPAWDQSWHKSISLSYYYQITGGESDLNKVSWILGERAAKYPHLFHMTSLPLYLLFGIGGDIAEMTNIFYFLVLISFVYLLGKEVYSRKAGLLASFIVSMYPIIFGLSRLYLIDFSLVALASVSFYFLLKFKKEQSLRNGIFLSLSILFGIFLKQIFAIFIALPLLFVLAKIVINLYKSGKIKRSYLLSGCIIAAGLAGIFAYFYIVHFSGMFLLHELAKNSSLNHLFSNLPVILLNFINIQVSFAFFLVFLFSLYFFKNFKEKTIFLLWIFVPIAVLAYTNTLSDGRYLMPILPAVAVLSSFGLLSISGNKLRVIIISLLMVFSFCQFFDISYSSEGRSIRLPLYEKVALYSNKMYIIDSARRENWQIEEILDFVHNDSAGRRANVGVLSDLQRFNDYNFAYVTYEKGYFNLISTGWMADPLQSDYVITKTGDRGKDSWRYSGVKNRYGSLERNNASFVLLKEYPLPDGSNAQVFKIK